MIKLTHANMATPVYVAISHIAAIYFSPSNKCTHIVSVGAIFPVVENIDDVMRLIKEAKEKGNE